MADVVTAGSSPQEQTGHAIAEVTDQIPASQRLESSNAVPVEVLVPVSASETTSLSVSNPEHLGGVKDESPQANAEESDSEGEGQRAGNDRRRRKHRSASEDHEEKEDDEEVDGSEGDHDKEGSHLSDGEEEGRGQEEEEGGDEEGDLPLPKEEDPTYVPTKGGYYLHDDRFEDTEQEPAAPKPPEASKHRADVSDRWTHDLYVESEQCPRDRVRDISNYEYDRRPNRSRKLNSFLSDADQKRLSQRRSEGSWNSRGGRHSTGKQGGQGRSQHWNNKGKEGVPPKGKSEEKKYPLATPSESLVQPQDGDQKVVEKSSEGVKDVVAEWPDLEPNKGDQTGTQQQERGGEMVKGGGEMVEGVKTVEGGEETGKDDTPDDNMRASRTESKEKRESSKEDRQEDGTFSRPRGTGERGPDDSTHHEPSANDSKPVAQWENRRGGRQGNRHQYKDEQRQGNKGPNEGDQRQGNRRPNEGDQRQGNRRPYEGDQRQGNRRPYEGDQRQRNRRPYEGNQRQGNRRPYEGDQRQGNRHQYDDDQRQKWSKQRPEGQDRGGEGGAVRSGRRFDGQQGQEDRETYRREGSNTLDASRDRPRGGGGTTPPGSRSSEGPALSLSDPQRMSEECDPRDMSRPSDSGKPKSLFHTGETEGTKSTKVYSLSAEEGVQQLSVTTSTRGMGRGRGWKERLESSQGEEVVSTAMAASTTRPGGAQKSNIKVIESLEQRRLVGKTAASLAATAIPPVESSLENTSPMKDKDEFEASGAVPLKEKGVGKSSGPGEEESIAEGTQATKPKRYSSRRQQKAGESGGDLLVGGSEDVIPMGYGPHGNPMMPMPWTGPNYQAYVAHQMQQMKLMMSQPPGVMSQPSGVMSQPPMMMSQPPMMMPQPHGMMEMGYPPGIMPYMYSAQPAYWQIPPPHSAVPLDPYPAMIPPSPPVPIPGMEGEGGGLPPGGGPSYVPLPMGSLYMPQVALEQQRASRSPSLPVTSKPRSQAIPIVSPVPPPQRLEPPAES